MIEFGIARGRTGDRTQAAANLPPTLGHNRVNGALRRGVRGLLLLAQRRPELADQVGGADNLLAQAAQELDRPGIHHRHVHDVVIGRVLHSHGARAGEHRREARVQLLPA